MTQLAGEHADLAPMMAFVCDEVGEKVNDVLRKAG